MEDLLPLRTDEEVVSSTAVPEYEVSQVLSGEITWDEYYAQKAC